MKAFLQSNPGLASRFDQTITFPDYSEDELQHIFLSLVDGMDMHVDTEAAANLPILCRGLRTREDFANARTIRTFFGRVVTPIQPRSFARSPTRVSTS
jgi:hypothetical protein